MNLAKQTLWIVVTLILLAFSAWYYAQFTSLNNPSKEDLSSKVDSTFTHLTVSQFNEEGHLINRLTTPFTEHIPKNNIHLIKNPFIIIKQLNQPAWEIKSKYAKSYNGGKEITFTQQVIVKQKSSAKNRESIFKTEEVTYYPKEKKATTELFVTFEQPGQIVESTGMNAYLDEARVELLHGARGSYDPSTKG